MHKRIGHASGGGENSQILGSYVLVLTVQSKPMSFKFKYQQSTNLTEKRVTYETISKHDNFCVGPN